VGVLERGVFLRRASVYWRNKLPRVISSISRTSNFSLDALYNTLNPLQTQMESDLFETIETVRVWKVQDQQIGRW
jgi:hypothetical protein